MAWEEAAGAPVATAPGLGPLQGKKALLDGPENWFREILRMLFQPAKVPLIAFDFFY